MVPVIQVYYPTLKRNLRDNVLYVVYVRVRSLPDQRLQNRCQTEHHFGAVLRIGYLLKVPVNLS
jgi:hypothetical protein